MGVLSNVEFLKSATELFTKSHETRSSLYITQKRLIEHDEVNGNENTLNEISKFKQQEPILKSSNISKSDKIYPILIRITNGKSDKSKKIKISTIVHSKDLSKFWKDYSSVIKSGSKGLKKKDKSKKKKKSK